MPRGTPFQPAHTTQFGMEPCERSIGGDITTVRCRFCVHIGRERREGVGVKRSRTKNTQLFQFPFRLELFKKHLVSQHTEEWARFQTLSEQAKLSFFNLTEVAGIHRFLDNDHDTLHFWVTRPAIVTDIVGDLFFHAGEEDAEVSTSDVVSKANAMKLFQVQDDNTFRVDIKNSLRFELAVQSIAAGCSFRQTSKVMDIYQRGLRNPKLRGINDHMVSQFARVIVAVTLQMISDILSDPAVWAFSLAADSSTHLGVPYLDQRVRVCIKGTVHNMHLALVPFFERHTSQNYVKLITTLLDTLCPPWRTKLISISSDGENTMTGRLGGVVTLLERQCSNPVLRIWCVAHQLDIVVKDVMRGVENEVFYKVAHALSVYLRTQHNLINDMGSKCPKDITRWIAFGNLVRWLLEHRRRLLAHFDEKNPLQAPSSRWWLIAGAISPLLDRIATTFTVIQSPVMVLSQQRQEVKNLFDDIQAILQICPSPHELDQTTIVEDDNWYVTKDAIIALILDQGSWARDLFYDTREDEQDHVLQEVGNFALHLVSAGLQIQAERDSENNPRELEAPYVMPHELVKLRHSAFVGDVVDTYRNHLAKHWTINMIEAAEKDHRELLAAHAREPDVKAALESHNEKTFFNEAWDCLNGRFPMLQQLCGGLATAFPNTSSVESDFSVVQWEKDSSRTRLTNLSLAGVMHAKQYDMLKSLVPSNEH